MTRPPTWSAVLVLFLMTGLGLVGLADDATKIRNQRSLGLRPWQKLTGQSLVAVTFAVLALQLPNEAGRTPASTAISFIRDVPALDLAFAGGVGGTVLFVGALTAGAYQVVTVLAHEERTETFAFPAAGLTTVDVATANGAVRITTTDADEVVVRARISEGLRRTGAEQQVIGDTLQLRASCPNFGSNWCAVDYTLEVPRHLALVIRTDDGPIEGSDLRSATVDADADHGRVSLAFAAPPRQRSGPLDEADVQRIARGLGLARDSIISDWDFNKAMTRDIQVDLRYILWNMKHVDHADNLLKEMNAE